MFNAWFRPLGIDVALRTGAIKTAPQTGNGSLNKPTLTVGTHALLSAGFAPEKLGLVIIDEQHKFGVSQREHLVRKGIYPHLLVMTATPIPRTLGLTLYGDLDVSLLGEMPKNRGKLQTHLRKAGELPRVWEFVRSRLKEGRQAYVVYARVEEQQADIKAVTKEYEALAKILLPYRAGLAHGQMKATDLEQVLESFRLNKIQALVTTSLIEVGVDVPNATCMVIENAELFGLAQLHQLRGRIGRGEHDSHCVLVSNSKDETAVKKLETLVRCNDGFEIAEADIKLRGPGELLGAQQSGMPRFRFADLTTDLDLIRQTRESVREASASTVRDRQE